MKIAICDDKKSELEFNVQCTNEYMKEKDISAEVYSFSNPDELLTACEKEKFELYILDMVMPMMSGVQLGNEIRKQSNEAQIIYITTAPEFALDSFSAQPIGYILKPVEKYKIFDILDIAFAKIQKDDETITIKTKQGIHTLKIASITYCEYKNHAITYMLLSGETLTSTTITGGFAKHIASLLKNEKFIHPHTSFVVNMNQVERLTREGFFLRGGNFVPISGKQFTLVRDKYLDYRLNKEALI